MILLNMTSLMKWESNKGVFIEIDPLIRKASWITIYIKELDNDDFDEAKW